VTRLLPTNARLPPDFVEPTADYIAACQEADGAIPWFAQGPTDPWDHVEAAMGLSIAGRLEEAEAAYDWLRTRQREDGAWLAAYRDGMVVDATRAETNFVAYAATGVWHHYLISGRRAFLEAHWPMVKRALAFVLRMQSPHGEIYWAWDTRTGVSRDALVTGCSSIYKSLEAGAAIAAVLGEPAEPYLVARARLGHALRHRPERFDRTWESKRRYSMDWFYPVLTGVVRSADADRRLDARWQEFVEPELGCRCVADQPWVTVAESCELVMALLAAGRRGPATRLFSCLHDFRCEDGSYWTGYAFVEDVLWPDERPTWTAAAILLAADALAGATGASRLFTDVRLPATPRSRMRASAVALSDPAQHAEGADHAQLLEQP